jgi:hypothetical protein
MAVKQFVSLASPLSDRWPEEYHSVIGGVVAFRVPKDTVATLTAISKGSMEPFVAVEPRVIDQEQIRRRLRMIDREPAAMTDDASHKWIYVYSASFGKATLTLTGPKDWSRTMILGSIYPPPEEAVGREPKFLKIEGDAAPSVEVDGYDNIWLSVVGEVEDGWHLDGGKAIGFRLTRIQEQEVPYDDAPRVKLFLQRSGSPTSGLAAIQRLGPDGLAATFRFRVQARPTPLC